MLTEVPRNHLAFDFFDFNLRLDAVSAAQADIITKRLSAADSAIDGWPALPATALGAALILVFVGVRPRLAEFH